MNQETSLSVIVPVFNECGVIGKVIGDIKAALSGITQLTFEIIVVNDGSTDLTSDEAQRAGATVISHACNLGYGKALKTGIARAKNDTIVIIDGDGTYPVDSIHELVRKFNTGFDMVVGLRANTNLSDHFWKRILRATLRQLTDFVTGQQIPDPNSGLRVFSKRTAQRFFDGLCDTFSFTTSLTLAFHLTKLCVAYVPINYQKRTSSSKVNLPRDTLRTLQYIVQAILRYNPIKLFLLLAAIPACMTFFVVCGYLISSNVYWLLHVIDLLIASLILFAMGLLADQARQIMNYLQENNSNSSGNK